MGYRSQVALAVTKELMPHFLSVLAKEPEVRTMVFKHNDTLDENYDGKGTLLVSWGSIKWYETFPEIKAINDFIKACENDMIEGFALERGEWQGDHIRFVRIGEDHDDCVERGSLHASDICTIRSLSY